VVGAQASGGAAECSAPPGADRNGLERQFADVSQPAENTNSGRIL
jgi:hypothetical protein